MKQENEEKIRKSKQGKKKEKRSKDLIWGKRGERRRKLKYKKTRTKKKRKEAEFVMFVSSRSNRKVAGNNFVAAISRLSEFTLFRKHDMNPTPLTS
jgi:hypothetical protein